MYPDTICINFSASIKTAVSTVKIGAFDYLPKPFVPRQVDLVLEKLERFPNSETKVAKLKGFFYRRRHLGVQPKNEKNTRDFTPSRRIQCHHPDFRGKRYRQRIPGETDSQLEPACSRSFRDGGLRDLPERYEEHRKENRPDRTRRRTAVGHDRPEAYHTELLKQFSDNPSFKKWLGDTILGVTYTQADKPQWGVCCEDSCS
jgi:hypothetical protein